MPPPPDRPPPPNRPSKRERTRAKLIAAGFRVLADRGDALTAADVANEAEVANGTFYNHFVDREDFVDTLAAESLGAINLDSAEQTEGDDPAWRFAVASSRVLEAGAREPLWGRAVLRLADHPRTPHSVLQRHLRTDLADGRRQGRFVHGDDHVTVDLVTGTLIAALRRIVTGPDASEASAIPDVVARLLEAIGIDGGEARLLAESAAHGSPPSNPPPVPGPAHEAHDGIRTCDPHLGEVIPP